MAQTTIEAGGRGATYRNAAGYSVYRLDRYPRHSVLSGQQRRTFLGHYATILEALRAHPGAELIEGTSYAPPFLGHLPAGEEG